MERHEYPDMDRGTGRSEASQFGDRNQQESMRQASQEEREGERDQYSQVSDDQSLGDSSRSFGESNGDTFGGDNPMPRYDGMSGGRERYGSAGAD